MLKHGTALPYYFCLRAMPAMASKAIGHVDCIVLELRAGIGGHEANLFAEQLLKMYYHVAMKNN